MMSAQLQTQRKSAISACYTMPFAWSGATAALAALDGFDPARSLRKAGLLDATTEITADSRLGPADFVLIALSLINAFDDELHGVAPQRMAKGTASMASRAMTSSTDLFGAIETMARFLEMVGAGCRIAQRRSADSAIIDIRADCENEQLRSILEEFFAHFVHQQLSYFLGHRLPLISFTTAALEHPAAGSQHPYLLSRVAHGRTTALTFSAEYLKRSRRAIDGDNPLSEALMLWLRQHPINGEVATACAGPSSLTSIVYSQLRNRDADVRECASLVALTPVELARGLSREATTYRALRRAALVERSRPFLHAGVCLDELADTLGYSDGRSCRRAIKLACGMTIHELRHAAISQSGAIPAAVARALEEQAAGLH